MKLGQSLWMLPALVAALAGPAQAQNRKTPPPPPTTRQVQPNHEALVAEGAYVATASDCSACHTLAGHAPYSGGVGFPLPIGTIYAPNITPDPRYGIGTYNERDFARAVREGILPNGVTLYPAMPYPSYARMTDHDIHALYVYFHDGVKPVAQATPANTLPWPLSMRWPLTIWRWLFAPTPRQAARATAAGMGTPQLKRGAYLVEGPGHCGACHTPRSLFLAEKALTPQGGDSYLSGGQVIDGWLAPSLRGGNRTGLGRWSVDDIVTFLRTGRAAPGAAFGSMTPVITHSTHAIHPEDLKAMAVFLKTLPAAHHHKPWHYDPQALIAVQQGRLTSKGAQIYQDRCAACHGTDGRGFTTDGMSVFPPLAGNPVVLSRNPISLVHIVQSGAATQQLPESPSGFAMPAYGERLSYEEIAAVLTYIRKSWGNHGHTVSEAKVRRLARSAPPSPTSAELPKN
ncbi:cytochrome c [Formicincola oecophyllae]|uniref:Cytochrome c n=1 Tax=Formicincola oecophyllae TaxID=2558361 RepID=A0A4Y6UCZ0_9PROT|nr:cytochrome c [Formicincola oecophyllae]